MNCDSNFLRPNALLLHIFETIICINNGVMFKPLKVIILFKNIGRILILNECAFSRKIFARHITESKHCNGYYR